MRISDWSSDVCSSDLSAEIHVMPENTKSRLRQAGATHLFTLLCLLAWCVASWVSPAYQMPSPIAVLRGMGEFLTNINLLEQLRSEEHTSELQSLMRISYAVFCLKKKQQQYKHTQNI